MGEGKKTQPILERLLSLKFCGLFEGGSHTIKIRFFLFDSPDLLRALLEKLFIIRKSGFESIETTAWPNPSSVDLNTSQGAPENLKSLVPP
jgi:hypothetical protein